MTVLLTSVSGKLEFELDAVKVPLDPVVVELMSFPKAAGLETILTLLQLD